MSEAISLFRTQPEDQRKHWNISDIIEYALSLSNRTEYGCPAIRSNVKELNMYFFDLVVNQQLKAVPPCLREAFEGMGLWGNRGLVPTSEELQDALRSHSFSGMFYLTFEGTYCMKPSIAEHLLAAEQYQALDEAGKDFLQKVADDLSCNSPFWDDFCPDLTPPYQRR